MDIKTFQEYSTRTLNNNLNQRDQIANMCIGSVSELCEATDIIKKHLYQGHDLNTSKVEEELGDAMYYISNLATMLNLDMSKILLKNYCKLKVRYPNGFSAKDSIERRDVNET